jgi:site-specific recombinase XerD
VATDLRQLRLKSLLGCWFASLREVRNVSPNTVQSYKDTWRLLYRFGIDARRLSPSGDWRLVQVDRQFVLAFLAWLENTRKCSISTRNLRMAAVHSFFKYVRGLEPVARNHCERILSVQRKRTLKPVVGYLESDEVHAVLDGVDLLKSVGLRDLALLLFAYNTGARVHEMANLQRDRLSLERNPSVRIWGKGRKQREIPLFPPTVKAIEAYLSDHRRCPPTAAAESFVFLGQTGDPMTRFGVADIIQRAFRRAIPLRPSLDRDDLTAHSMRHTTAVHLMHGGASLATIQNWLGHESLASVQIYLAMNLKNKRDILEHCFATDYVTKRLAGLTDSIPPPDRAEDWLQGL